MNNIGVQDGHLCSVTLSAGIKVQHPFLSHHDLSLFPAILKLAFMHFQVDLSQLGLILLADNRILSRLGGSEISCSLTGIGNGSGDDGRGGGL